MVWWVIKCLLTSMKLVSKHGCSIIPLLSCVVIHVHLYTYSTGVEVKSFQVKSFVCTTCT